MYAFAVDDGQFQAPIVAAVVIGCQLCCPANMDDTGVTRPRGAESMIYSIDHVL